MKFRAGVVTGLLSIQKNCGSRWRCDSWGTEAHGSVTIPYLSKHTRAVEVAINIFNNKGYNEGKWRIRTGEVKGSYGLLGRRAASKIRFPDRDSLMSLCHSEFEEKAGLNEYHSVRNSHQF